MRREGGRKVTYLGITFAIVIIISLALLLWIELDKKHFKDKTTKR